MAQRVLLERTLATPVLQIPIGVKAPSNVPVHVFHLRTKPKQMGERERRQKRVRRPGTCVLRCAGLGSRGRHWVRKPAIAPGGGGAKGWLAGGVGARSGLPRHSGFIGGPRYAQAYRAAGHENQGTREILGPRFHCRSFLRRRALPRENRARSRGGGGFRHWEPEGDAAIPPTPLELLASAPQAATPRTASIDRWSGTRGVGLGAVFEGVGEASYIRIRAHENKRLETRDGECAGGWAPRPDEARQGVEKMRGIVLRRTGETKVRARSEIGFFTVILGSLAAA